LERVTVVWVAKGGASSRVLALPKTAVVGVVGGCFLFLALSVCALLWVGAVSVQSSLRARENRQLEEALGRKDALLEESSATAQELLREKERMVEELREIRATESRIRRFLGLNEQSYDGKRSHQGGMGPNLAEDGPLGKAEPLDGATGLGLEASFAESSQTLRSGLQEVVAYLQDRRAESKRIPMILPVDSDQTWLSCEFGWREDPVTGLGREFHNGIDIAGPWKSAVLTPADGEVLQVGKDRLLGTYVKLRHGASIKTIYGHLASAAVKAGKKVKRGEVIGHMGNSGRSTGTHLHYSVSIDGRYVDPQDYIWDRPFKTLTL